MAKLSCDYLMQIILCLYEILLYLVWGKSRCQSKVRLDGKTAIVTGANTGIGKEVARDLSRRGARVILACRDAKKSEAAASEIRADTGGQVIVRNLDLASLSSVRKFAEVILTEESKIHILVNNAGVAGCPKWTTEDGFEMQMGVNHFGHFLLTNLLLEKVKESAPSRIVNVSSLAHRGAGIDFSDLNCDTNYDPMDAYCRSKLANVLFTKELAERLKGSGVTTYAVHPGLVITEISRHMNHSASGIWLKILKSSEEGAQPVIYCAVDEDAGKETGLYYIDCQVASVSRRVTDKSAKLLWEKSESLVGLK